MAWKQTKPHRLQVPSGYRLLSGTARIPTGKSYLILWQDEHSGWQVPGGSLAGGSAEDFYGWIAVPKVAKIDRAKHPKASTKVKATWTPRTLEIRGDVPRTVLRALVLESIDEINELGAENAKLKNQIAKLKEAK